MSNPALRRLGFGPEDRVVIVHADDVGMCHAANVAFWEDQAFGVVTCGSVMMPCPWVPEMAAWCREHPGTDVGVHITLNSEWEGYRWGPLSTRDPKSGLVDKEGYMWSSVEDVHRHMDVDAAIAEMRTQIETALAMGIDVTHIDTHMGTVMMHSQLFRAYVQLAMEFRVPAMLPRIPKERMSEWGVAPELGQMLASTMDEIAVVGFPVLDGICAAMEGGDHLNVYRRLFDSVPVGLTHLLLHPSVPGHDIEAITDSAPYRIADYQTFLCPELEEYVAGQGIHLIGYRRLRDLIRNEMGASHSSFL
jgi:predicted glycoside hydrolase/deacetylase ChbG (UPF0249 family)